MSDPEDGFIIISGRGVIAKLPCPACQEPVQVVTIGSSDSTHCDNCNTSLIWTKDTGLVKRKDTHAAPEL